jgi:hypothetical protein
MPTAIPKEAMARAALATPTPIAVAHAAADPSARSTIAPSPANMDQKMSEGSQEERGNSYLLFGILAGGLVAGLAVLQVRKRLRI